MKLPAMAGGSPFAHLLGRSRVVAGKAKAEDADEEDEKAKRAESEEESEDQEREEEEKDDAEKAEALDDEEGDGDDEPKKSKKGKKARKAKADAEDGDPDEEDETDDEDDDAEAKAERRGAVRMQKRCEAIFASKHAAANVALAAQLAFRTRMSASEAIGVLAASAAGVPERRASAGLHERMGAVKAPKVGSDAPQGEPALAERILAAGKKRRGEA